MKNLVVIFCLTLVTILNSVAQNTTKGYYYDGTKREVTINTALILVYFDKNNISIDSINAVYAIKKELILNDRKADSLYACVIEIDGNYENVVSGLKKKPYVFDVEPVLGERGNTVVSNIFYVQLKSIDDTIVLKSMSEQTGTKMEGPIIKDSPDPLLWYRLSTDKNAGNALNQSITYGESGLFAAVDAGFVSSVNFNGHLIGKNSGPSDSFISDQWAIADLYDIWAEGIRGSNVKIALIDDGVDTTHYEFESLISTSTEINGYDGMLYSPTSYIGYHGTSMAGVIFSNHNDYDIAGIAPEAELFDICLFDEYYFGHYNSISLYEEMIPHIYMAFTQALINGSDIILCPWDYIENYDEIGTYYTSILLSVFRYCSTVGRGGKGTVIVYASGKNVDDSEGIIYPADIYDSAIVVGASTFFHERQWESCYGDCLDIVAPGEYILSTESDGGWHDICGCSGSGVASSHVAGIVALMLSANPNLTHSQVDWILKHTAYKSPDYVFNADVNHREGLWNTELGYGEVQGALAVELAQSISSFANLVIKDNISDIGIEPSVSNIQFDSPSIVIRDASNVNIMSTIGPGDTRMISVTVHNHSTTDVVVDPADVKLYYRNYTSGTLTWNTSLFSSPISPAGTSPVTISANGGSHTFVIPLTMPDVYPVTSGQIWRGMLVAVIDDNTSNIHGFTDINMPIDDFVAMNRLVAAKGYTHYQDPTPGDPILPPKPKLAVNPNPTLGRTVVELNGLATETVATLILTDGFGNLITTEQMNTDRSSIDLTGKPSGIYYVYVVVGEEVADVKKVILQ